LLGFPGPPYIGVARVTTVMLGYMTQATFQIGQGDAALPPLTFSLIALDGTLHACMSVFWIPGYPGPPALGPLQRPCCGPGVKRQLKLLEKTLMRRHLMRRTMTKTAKDQKTSSRAPAGEGRDHVHVSSSRLHAEQEDEGQKTVYRARYPRQGGDQLSPCLHKAAQWLLATPLKIAWTVQGTKGRRQLPPPTPVDRRHYCTKTTSTKE
jgi:hypothetical protein